LKDQRPPHQSVGGPSRKKASQCTVRKRDTFGRGRGQKETKRVPFAKRYGGASNRRTLEKIKAGGGTELQTRGTFCGTVFLY